MGDHDVTVVATPADAGELVAGLVWDRFAAREPGGRFLLALPAGRTPVTTYAAMVAGARHRSLDLTDLVVVMVDEYLGPDGKLCDPDAHFSCRRAIEHDLALPLRAAGLQPEHVWCPDPHDPGAYDEAIAAAGGLDLVLLASGGSDGHVAFNPPGTPSDSVTRVVTLAATTRADNVRTFADFTCADDVPTAGVSVGLATVSSAREVVLLLLGAEKRESLRRVTTATGFDASWPATILHDSRRALIVADVAAAGA